MAVLKVFSQCKQAAWNSLWLLYFLEFIFLYREFYFVSGISRSKMRDRLHSFAMYTFL